MAQTLRSHGQATAAGPPNSAGEPDSAKHLPGGGRRRARPAVCPCKDRICRDVPDAGGPADRADRIRELKTPATVRTPIPRPEGSRPEAVRPETGKATEAKTGEPANPGTARAAETVRRIPTRPAIAGP